jgi:hypothetical protein
MRTVTRCAFLFLIAASVMAAEPYRAVEADWGRIVDGVTFKNGAPGFGAVRLGMTHFQAEKAVGKALPVHKEEGSVCGEWITEPLPSDGCQLQLQFSGPGRDAVVQSIDVRPASGDHATDRTAVLKRIKKRFPDLVFVPSMHEPDLVESEAWVLTYVQKNDPGRAVLFNLSWGLLSVTLTECLD